MDDGLARNENMDVFFAGTRADRSLHVDFTNE